MAPFIEHFASLPDPRVVGSSDRKLLDIIAIAILGTICGAEGWDDFAVRLGVRPFCGLWRALILASIARLTVDLTPLRRGENLVETHFNMLSSAKFPGSHPPTPRKKAKHESELDIRWTRR
ncbi:transposase family protein [Sorangium sp. So ce362]|uniref:transposase family protein n=1 Tax=Sorangium sp. So ce362 TaxID=3133303 RepID=UPI003F5F1044